MGFFRKFLPGGDHDKQKENNQVKANLNRKLVSRHGTLEEHDIFEIRPVDLNGLDLNREDISEEFGNVGFLPRESQLAFQTDHFLKRLDTHTYNFFIPSGAFQFFFQLRNSKRRSSVLVVDQRRVFVKAWILSKSRKHASAHKIAVVEVGNTLHLDVRIASNACINGKGDVRLQIISDSRFSDSTFHLELHRMVRLDEPIKNSSLKAHSSSETILDGH